MLVYNTIRKACCQAFFQEKSQNLFCFFVYFTDFLKLPFHGLFCPGIRNEKDISALFPIHSPGSQKGRAETLSLGMSTSVSFQKNTIYLNTQPYKFSCHSVKRKPTQNSMSFWANVASRRIFCRQGRQLMRAWCSYNCYFPDPLGIGTLYFMLFRNSCHSTKRKYVQNPCHSERT